MGRFIARRLLGAIPLLVGITIISFMFMHLMPGGPDSLYARSGRMNQEQLDAIRQNMGLDQPVVIQYVRWVGNLVRGDLGNSYVQFRPVRDIILERLPNTMLLVGAGLVIAVTFSLIFGIVAAIYQYSFFDHLFSFVSFFGMAMPVFWFGLMLQLLFAVQLGWLPTSGMGSMDDGGIVERIRHLILPASVLGVGSIAFWSRYVRSSMLEVIRQDYMRTARAKGLREWSVFSRHALKNALIPFVTVIGIDIPLYFVGAVVTETIFSWPGMGRLFYDSLNARDYPVLMGLLIFSAVLIVIGNLIADIAYAYLDPRIKYS